MNNTGGETRGAAAVPATSAVPLRLSFSLAKGICHFEMKRAKKDRTETAKNFCCVPQECAAIMKVLSETPRLLIIRALIAGPRHVAAIAKQTGLTPARVSHHLARMRLAGVVENSREGQTIVYRIAARIATSEGLDLGCCGIRFRKL